MCMSECVVCAICRACGVLAVVFFCNCWLQSGAVRLRKKLIKKIYDSHNNRTAGMLISTITAATTTITATTNDNHRNHHNNSSTSIERVTSHMKRETERREIIIGEETETIRTDTELLTKRTWNINIVVIETMETAKDIRAEIEAEMKTEKGAEIETEAQMSGSRVKETEIATLVVITNEPVFHKISDQ